MATSTVTGFRSGQTVSFTNPKNVLVGPALNPFVQSMYSIALFDTTAFDVVNASGLDPANRTNAAEYYFRVPPKTHEFSEPTTAQIIPTQDGGKFIETHGSIIKDLRISGTTGLRPNKKLPTDIPLFSRLRTVQDIALGIGPFDAPDILNGEATGFDDIIFLRNLFRYYSDRKETNERAGNTICLWRNAKDDDYWVVEPVEFRLSQASSSPLTYNYNIHFKTITRFDATFSLGEDPLASIRALRRFFARIQQYVRDFSDSFLIIASQINRIKGFVSFATNTFLLGPMLGVIRGLAAISAAQTGLYKFLFRSLTEMSNNFRVAHEELLSSSLAAPGAGRDILDISNAMARTRITIAKVLHEHVFREASADPGPRRERFSSAYTYSPPSGGPARRPTTGGASSFIGSEPDIRSVGSATVYGGDTIRTLATRVLGDAGRWHVLVSLNDLRAPYVNAVGGEGILKPGDSVLYPLEGTSGVLSSSISSQGTGNPIYNAYGTDLKVKSVQEGNFDNLTDLAISNTGDLAVITGLSNVEQAVKIKFSTEQKELPLHPRFGTKFPIGSKASPDSFNSFRINARATILSDPRIGSIESMNFALNGDVMFLDAQLKLKNEDDILSTNFIVRNL